MSTDEAVIADISVHLAASKNRRYRASIFALFHALALFLQDNGLTTRHLLGREEMPPEDFRIVQSDLTPEGLEVMKRALHRWVAGIVASKWPVSDTSVLRKALEMGRRTDIVGD
ncbi:MAG: hypothetical protein IPJ17_07025 [Holophagales bacterium]|jgi:hypothetical protein|nr:MAG: hypothetical protein IPJ17_07025 [Holophagales bacterium]